jgi:DNA-binding NtrC family response regulator
MLAAMSPTATQTVIESAQVLLIDDDDFVTTTLPHYLAKRGCNVVTARDRRSAESLISTLAYDLIVFDPYMTGEINRDAGALLEKIRAQQPAARIVLLSAYTSSDMDDAGAACGAVAVLTKPQSPSFLTQLVISALKSHPHTESN